MRISKNVSAMMSPIRRSALHCFDDAIIDASTGRKDKTDATQFCVNVKDVGFDNDINSKAEMLSLLHIRIVIYGKIIVSKIQVIKMN
jgi:hypothetical protein